MADPPGLQLKGLRQPIFMCPSQYFYMPLLGGRNDGCRMIKRTSVCTGPSQNFQVPPLGGRRTILITTLVTILHRQLLSMQMPIRSSIEAQVLLLLPGRRKTQHNTYMYPANQQWAQSGDFWPPLYSKFVLSRKYLGSKPKYPNTKSIKRNTTGRE